MGADFDSNDIEALKRRIAELEAAQSQSRTVAMNSGVVVSHGLQVVNGHFIGRDYVQVIHNILGSGEDGVEAQHVIAAYLAVLANDLAGLKLGVVDAGSSDPSKQTPLQLADIYVPLNTSTQIPASMTLREWLALPPRDKHIECGSHDLRAVTALEALAENRELTLLGKPGSGKSTFGARVLLALAQIWQGRAYEQAHLGSTWCHGALFPIRVVLRRFAQQLPRSDAPARAGDLWAFILRELNYECYGLCADACKYLERMAQRHGALILLDGLDECGDSSQRARVQSAVHDLMRNAGPASRFILTARPYALPSGTNPKRGIYALADLEAEQIELFINGWYAAVVKHGWRLRGDALRLAEDLLRAQQRADLHPLARNPLLLTLMATLHTSRGSLPDDRADLYEESVELLLLHWNRPVGAEKALLERLDLPALKLADVREVLEGVAFTVHEQNAGREGTADVGEDALVRAFLPLLKSKDKATPVLDYIEERAGLLIGQGKRAGERQFTFSHRTFQEFLAACYLAAHREFEQECARLARTAPTNWQVVLPMAARVAGTARGCGAADGLIGGIEVGAHPAPQAQNWMCALVAGQQLLEIGASALQTRQHITRRVTSWLVASLPLHPQAAGLPVSQRAQAGQVLAQLGDVRFDAQRWYLPDDEMLGFVKIDANPRFMIGTRGRPTVLHESMDIRIDEINDKLTPTPELYIGRYAVTVAQFRDFVEATQFELEDSDALRGLPSYPVRYVTWYEAKAYCQWLGEQLATVGSVARHLPAALIRESGWTVNLPSELEWEVAARGGRSDELFSWAGGPDPERANYGDSGIEEPAAVGCFPPNDFGLHDMLGNVWEWTRSRYEPYPYRKRNETLAPERESIMVLRGGGFGNDAQVVRCAFRLRYLPVDRGDDVGFRVVLHGPVP